MKNALAWICLFVAACIFVVTHIHWLGELPPRIATHFDTSGRANGWMSRKDHGFFMLLFGLGVPGVAALMWTYLRRLPPSWLNVPKASFWRSPENFPIACDIMKKWGQWQATGLLIWMTLLNYQIVAANRTSPPRLNSIATIGLSVVLLAFVASSIGWLFWRFWSAKLPPASP
jgi:uncharacterized membrane protein